MHEPALHQALENSVTEVLEKMFFISVFEEPLQPPAPLASDITAQLEFDGDSPGSFTLCTDQATARLIAGDFLGEDETALAAQQVEEVVCELANMICGSVLSRVVSQVAFRLGSPQILHRKNVEISKEVRASEAAPLPSETANMPPLSRGALTATINRLGSICTVVAKYAF